MLKIFDKEHNAIGYITKYKDCQIEAETATGDKTISFKYLARHHSLENEYYVRTREDEYVIKEVSENSDGFPEIVAVLNLEELQQKAWQSFSVTDATIDEAARTVLAGTGWTIGVCDVTKRRNAGMVHVSSLEVIQNLCTAFMCEPVFDTINKQVSFFEQRGEDKGVYFLAGLNLKRLQKKSSTYDYYTRIIPIGADGLTIEEINDGKNYLENHQYSDKVLTYLWKDESYTDAQALKEDAEKKLEDLSKPEKSYSAEVRNLAKQNAEYTILDYRLGDTVTLIDRFTGTREKQRIRKLTEYPQDPEKNTCELANTVLTFEELQQKMQAAADIINYTVAGDGRYTGTISVSDILKFEEGLAGSNTAAGLAGDITSLEGDLSQVKLTLGEVQANYLKADEADLKYATVENLTVLNQTVESISGDYASFKTMTTGELSALSARIDSITATTITTEYLDAHYANLDLANVDTANIRQGFLESLMVSQGVVADKVVGGEIVATDVLTGVNLYANDITAGTLSVDRLVIRGSEKSIVYELNSIDGAEQLASTETLNGEILTPRTITADRIVAESITSNEINVADLVATGLVEANRLTANNINVTSLSSLSANIGQLTIDGYLTTNTARTSYNQAAAGMTMDKNGVGGWGSETQYWNMTTGGQLTAAGVDINGKITATSLNIIGGSATFRMPNNMAALGAGTLKFERIYTEDSGFAWDSKTGTVMEDVASSVAYLALRFSSSSALIYTDGSIRADGTVYSEGVQATTIGAKSFSGESVYANNIDVRSIVFHGGTGQYAAAIAFDDTAAGTLCIGDSLLSTMTLIADRVYVTADEIELNGTVSANSINEGGTALSSKYAEKSHTHSYLPLSGGTVTGTTTINATTTIARYLCMGASTTTNTDRQIIFRVDSGTYLHCSYFYGGSSSSTTAIGAYDSRNSRGIWAYNDKDNMFTVTPPAQMLGTLKVTGAATLNSTLTVAGSTTISGQISVTGAIKCQNAYDNTVTNAANLYITSNYNFRRSTASSKRYKHDIAQIGGELDARKLLDLPVKQYVYNLDYLSEEDLRYGKAIPGFIAEDVAEIYPIAAEYADGVVEDWNIRLIVPPILALVQEEHTELTAHAARLDTAEARIESLQAQLDQAHEEIAKLKEQLKAAA